MNEADPVQMAIHHVERTAIKYPASATALSAVTALRMHMGDFNVDPLDLLIEKGLRVWASIAETANNAHENASANRIEQNLPPLEVGFVTPKQVYVFLFFASVMLPAFLTLTNEQLEVVLAHNPHDPEQEIAYVQYVRKNFLPDLPSFIG